MSIPINKTLEQVRNDLFSRVSDAQAAGYLPQAMNLNKGVVRGLIEIWAWGLWQLYQFMVVVFRQLFPTLATGSWLDLHCRQVGVTRQAATRATGTVVFSRTGTEENVIIPAGTVVRTLPDGAGEMYRFLTTADVVLPDGSADVSVEVRAQEYGRQSNVTTGMISEIVTPVPGVDSVSNSADWLLTEAVDVETDEALRERYTLAWKNINGSTRYAYESWAREVSGVVSVMVMDSHPRGQGTVDVVIRGSAGIPSADLLSQVDAVVQENRPINDDVLVLGPTPVDVFIDAELVLVSGTPDVTISEVEERISALFTMPPALNDVAPLSIGEDLTLDRLVSVIMAVPGIKEVNFTLPESNVSVLADGLAVLTGVSITHVWAEEA